MSKSTASEQQNLQRLLTWLSPAFPVGAFAWSAGLETAIVERAVHDASSMQIWATDVLCHGGLKADAIFLAQAYKAAGSDEKLQTLAELAIALFPALERRQESLMLGQAFISAAQAWPSPVFTNLPQECPYPIAIGAIAKAHDIDLLQTLTAFLTAGVQTQVSVAIRLVPLGQTAGLAIMASLEKTIAERARDAATARLEEIGTIAYAADIAQMRHETLQPRIFRS